MGAILSSHFIVVWSLDEVRRNKEERLRHLCRLSEEKDFLDPSFPTQQQCCKRLSSLSATQSSEYFGESGENFAAKCI